LVQIDVSLKVCLMVIAEGKLQWCRQSYEQDFTLAGILFAAYVGNFSLQLIEVPVPFVFDWSRDNLS